jgi:hypothetical protein
MVVSIRLNADLYSSTSPPIALNVELFPTHPLPIALAFEQTSSFHAENQSYCAYIDSAMFYHIKNLLTHSGVRPQCVDNDAQVYFCHVKSFAPFALLFASLASRFFLDTIV